MPIDQRFFDYQGPQSLRALLAICGIESDDADDIEITGIASSQNAIEGDLCFFEGKASQAKSVSSRAAACFVKPAAAAGLPAGVIPIGTSHPRASHKLASEALYKLKDWQASGEAPSIHDTAIVAPTAFIGAGAAIGAGTTIGPGAAIGPGVQIGENSVIGANVCVRCALVGNHVKLYSGASIGEAGFGVTVGPEGAEDVPQWGRVIIQDHVTVGANTCIDRGAFSDTIIGERTKIDNLVQIAHNVVVGRNVMMASFTGISGTTQIGDGVVMGGRVGIADHVHIGAGAKLAASSGIFRDIPAGETWGGVPAKPLKQYLREVAWIQKQIAPKKTPK
ncbi:MAG: UDP-3-O-(3-hydroxymyristoyl)glucosamine N-acyltransferase [Henriciella sp.]|nr:UDP-3-O-(3-hydroxymyristoyl)glucosamine N-acyltransferase [Henriciella sp.]